MACSDILAILPKCQITLDICVCPTFLCVYLLDDQESSLWVFGVKNISLKIHVNSYILFRLHTNVINWGREANRGFAMMHDVATQFILRWISRVVEIDKESYSTFKPFSSFISCWKNKRKQRSLWYSFVIWDLSRDCLLSILGYTHAHTHKLLVDIYIYLYKYIQWLEYHECSVCYCLLLASRTVSDSSTEQCDAVQHSANFSRTGFVWQTPASLENWSHLPTADFLKLLKWILFVYCNKLFISTVNLRFLWRGHLYLCWCWQKQWMSLSMQSCLGFSKSQADKQINDFFHYGALLRLVSSCLVLPFTAEWS